MKTSKGLIGVASIGCIIHTIYAISYLVNLIFFISCDFNSPYKEEITHGIGILIPYASFLTVWM